MTIMIIIVIVTISSSICGSNSRCTVQTGRRCMHQQSRPSVCNHKCDNIFNTTQFVSTQIQHNLNTNTTKSPLKIWGNPPKRLAPGNTGATGPCRLAVRESRGLHSFTRCQLHCYTVPQLPAALLLHLHCTPATLLFTCTPTALLLHCSTAASYTATLYST